MHARAYTRHATSAPSHARHFTFGFVPPQRLMSQVVLTPGSSQHAAEPGWFRFCFAFVPPSALNAALDKIEVYARGLGLASRL